MNVQDYATNADDIFILPEVFIKIKQLIDDDTTSMNDIADLINYDPAIMTQVLKIANSALYKFPNTITSVSKAIQIIGTNSIYELVLAYGVTNVFDKIDPEIIDLETFWEQAVNCALLSQFLAEEIGSKDPEKLFICGLLHNIGELITVQLTPDIAKKCAGISSEYPPLTLQKEHLGFSYADISASVLKLWGIPDDISQIIGCTHVSESVASTNEHKIMQLAYLLSLNNIHQEYYPLHHGVTANMYEDLGLDLNSINNALDFSNLQLIDALALFSPSSFSMY
jgi:HD-like signal output (HDOD) protein